MSAANINSIEELEKRLRTNQKSLLFARLAELYIKVNRVDDAIDLCIDGIKQNPRYLTGNFILAKAYIVKKEYDKAESELKKVLSYDNQHLGAHKLLGDLMRKLGYETQAVALYRNIIRIDPLESKIHQLLETLYGGADSLKNEGGPSTGNDEPATALDKELSVREPSRTVPEEKESRHFEEMDIYSPAEQDSGGQETESDDFSGTGTPEDISEEDTIETIESLSDDVSTDDIPETGTDAVMDDGSEEFQTVSESPEETPEISEPVAAEDESTIDLDFPETDLDEPDSRESGTSGPDLSAVEQDVLMDHDAHEPEIDDFRKDTETGEPVSGEDSPGTKAGSVLTLDQELLDQLDELFPEEKRKPGSPADEDISRIIIDDDTRKMEELTSEETSGGEDTGDDAFPVYRPEPDAPGQDISIESFEDADDLASSKGDAMDFPTDTTSPDEETWPPPGMEGGPDEDVELILPDDTDTSKTESPAPDEEDISGAETPDNILGAYASETGMPDKDQSESAIEFPEEKETGFDSGAAPLFEPEETEKNAGSDISSTPGETLPDETQDDSRIESTFSFIPLGRKEEKPPSEKESPPEEEKEEEMAGESVVEEAREQEAPEADTGAAEKDSSAEKQAPETAASGQSSQDTPSPGMTKSPNKMMSPTLGEIYAAQGQYAKALKVFETLLEKHPDEKKYKEKISEMKSKLASQSGP